MRPRPFLRCCSGVRETGGLTCSRRPAGRIRGKLRRSHSLTIVAELGEGTRLRVAGPRRRAAVAAVCWDSAAGPDVRSTKPSHRSRLDRYSASNQAVRSNSEIGPWCVVPRLRSIGPASACRSRGMDHGLSDCDPSDAGQAAMLANGDLRRGSLVPCNPNAGKPNCPCTASEHPLHGPRWWLLPNRMNGKTST